MAAKVLVIGSGGREQALAWKLAQSPKVKKVYVAPGNVGSRGKVENVGIGFTDGPALLEFVQAEAVDFTVIGQEAASEAGVADLFQAHGRLIFGVTKSAARIETSKVFSKDLMTGQNIPTAAYQTFSDPAEARAFANSRPLPVVIKADGLATGKGVIIASSETEINDAIDTIMVRKIFGDSGNSVVIEDFLQGQEVSVHAFCDGQKAVVFPASQDHKQIFDGDKGPNTGGVGVIAPIPWVTQSHLDFVRDRIVQPALAGMQQKGAAFRGVLYPGLFINGDDVKLLEFNCRFGDPEAEVYMRLLDGDLYDILTACARGDLDPALVKWRSGFAVSVVLCSPGYPGDYPKALPITGIAKAESQPGIVVFHAGTVRKDGQLVTAGGRVLNVTATAPTLDEALGNAYAAIKFIHFPGMHYRKDIGRRRLG